MGNAASFERDPVVEEDVRNSISAAWKEFAAAYERAYRQALLSAVLDWAPSSESPPAYRLTERPVRRCVLVAHADR